MLANLDNEVCFKKVFTNVEVFTAFVKDILGIEMHIKKVKAEKILPTKVGPVKFKMDLLAKDMPTNTVVKIQKVDYDYTHSRSSHYFLPHLLDVQDPRDSYTDDREVYIIVVATAAYKISDTGKPIKDDLVITDIYPCDLKGRVIRMPNHKVIILNPTYIQPDTPESILDWLHLISESMKNPDNPNINLTKPAILKAAQLAERDKLTPQQLADAKIQEMRKQGTAVGEKQAVDKALEEVAKQAAETDKKRIIQALKSGKLSIEDIVEIFEVSITYVQELAKEMENS